MIDLSPAHLAIVEGILAEHVPECEVRAFGSRAIWNAKDYSDLDLAIIGDEPLPRGALARLKEAFEESRLPMRVDVVDWHAIADGFRQAIESDCVVVQSATPRAGWRETTLGEFAPFRYGKSLPASKRNPSGRVPVLGSNGVVGHHDFALTDGPTVIIGRKGTAGAIHYSPVPCWPIDTTFFVTGSDAELVRFKYYALGALGLDGMNTDSAVPGLNRNAAHAREVRVPEEQDQRAIARVLGALDDRIELNRLMSATLEEMARALFRSWFVDFDPVRAKAEGRPSGLPPALDALFPASSEASELGEIPAGWEVKTLGDVIDVNPKRSIRRGDVATHVEMAALPTSGPQVAAWTQRAFTSGSRFIRGDTLLARITPSLENGKTAFVDFLEEGETAWGSTEFIVLRPKEPWPPEMAYVMAREPDFREHAIVNMTGTSGRQRVPADAVSAYPLAVAPVGVAAAFGDFVQPWFERSTCLSRQSRALAEQRDALLPRLVSGEVGAGSTGGPRENGVP